MSLESEDSLPKSGEEVKQDPPPKARKRRTKRSQSQKIYRLPKKLDPLQNTLPWYKKGGG